MALTIGVVKETFPGERRVALVPAALPKLIQAGAEILVEAGAGAEAGYGDPEYAGKGARIAAALLWRQPGGGTRGSGTPARRPGGDRLLRFPFLAGSGEGNRGRRRDGFRNGNDAADHPRARHGCTVLDYKAVLLAATHLPRMFPMLMTAAGTITPARVLVLGAGVAGLQAIATARRLGAVVAAYDVRPAVKEQVESVGAKFLERGVTPERKTTPSTSASANS